MHVSPTHAVLALKAVLSEDEHNRLKRSLQQPPSPRREGLMILTVFVLFSLGSGCRHHRLDSSAARPLPQRAYVWQRDWNAPVVKSLNEGRDVLDGCVVLAA